VIYLKGKKKGKAICETGKEAFFRRCLGHEVIPENTD
jgi:hypothetical protein